MIENKYFWQRGRLNGPKKTGTESLKNSVRFI